MALFTVSVPTGVAEQFIALFTRMVNAVERIAGPVQEYRPVTQSTMEDYAYVDPQEAQRVQDEAGEFAQRHMVVPGSPAYVQLVEEFERSVEAAYGPGSKDNLPWRVKNVGVLPK